jgi:hypothetical protein
MEKKLLSYQKTIEDIEQTLVSQVDTHQIQRALSPQALKAVLQGQNELFLALSRKVAQLHDRMAKEKQDYDRYKKLMEVNDSNMDIQPRM